MKKTYIHPNTEVIAVETAGMMATSLYGNELGAPLNNLVDDDGIPNVFRGESSGSFFDADAIVNFDDNIIDQ